jgi:hypothetical protein
MLTRREVIAGAVAGTGAARVTAAAGDTATVATAQTLESERLAAIERRLADMVAELREANRGCATGSCDVVAKLRELMAQALRSSAKFPDFVEVGSDVFYTLYDWHVRNQLPLQTTRTADGRYGLTFMFTQVLLRPDAQPGFLGFPYDARA